MSNFVKFNGEYGPAYVAPQFVASVFVGGYVYYNDEFPEGAPNTMIVHTGSGGSTCLNMPIEVVVAMLEQAIKEVE